MGRYSEESNGCIAFMRCICVVVATLCPMVYAAESCDEIKPTSDELNQVIELATPVLGSKDLEVKVVFWPLLPVRGKEPTVQFIAYTEGQSVPNALGVLRKRTTCVLGEQANCTTAKDILWHPGEREVSLDSDIPPTDLAMLLNHLSGVLSDEESLSSVRYLDPYRGAWSLEEHGYSVTTRDSAYTGVDYVFTYSCSFFGKCRWRLRNRIEFVSLCGTSVTCLGC